MRLDKYISYALDVSRADAKQLIKKKVIFVNGIMINDPNYNVNEEVDNIAKDGIALKYNKFIYIMMNKPKGYLSATFDKYKSTVLDLVNEYKKYNLFIVGRLDIDTEGLLLLTNDGEFNHKITSPNHEVEKIYYVEVDGEFQENHTNILKQGITISDGKGGMFKTKKAYLEIINSNSAHLTISEGKFHQIKNMCKYLGLEVTYLKRIKIGNLELDKSLSLGEYRLLTNEELQLLKSTHII